MSTRVGPVVTDDEQMTIRSQRLRSRALTCHPRDGQPHAVATWAAADVQGSSWCERLSQLDEQRSRNGGPLLLGETSVPVLIALVLRFRLPTASPHHPSRNNRAHNDEHFGTVIALVTRHFALGRSGAATTSLAGVVSTSGYLNGARCHAHRATQREWNPSSADLMRSMPSRGTRRGATQGVMTLNGLELEALPSADR